MKRPLFGYLLLSCFALSVAYAVTLRKEPVTTAEVMPFAAGLFCMVILWYWMVCNVITNRKKMTHPLAWGLFLLFANWIAAVVYFFVKYAPAEHNFALRRFREWMIGSDASRYVTARIAAVSLAAAILHHFLTETLYLLIPLYDFPVYRRLVGIVYFPFTEAILLVYGALSIDTEHPSKNVILFARTMRFLYTYLLILVVATLVAVRERRRMEKAAARERDRR